MTVGRSSYCSQWDAIGVYDHRALEADLAPIHGAFASLIAAAGGFRDATIYGHIRKIQAEHLIVGVEYYLV